MLSIVMDKESYTPHRACIEINDNCFIGGSFVVVGYIAIEPNAIVAAVTKDVLLGTIVVGNLVKTIGSYDSLH